MSLLSRRKFLVLSSAAGLKAFAQGDSDTVAVRLHPDRPLFTVPKNFVGLSYEMQQLSEPDRFSPQNKELIAQIRALAPTGIVRLGGNMSDSGYWMPTADSPIPPRQPAYAFGEPKTRDKPFPIMLEDVKRLRGFLDATGWTCIYGINLATNVPSVAVEEAVAVTKIMGAKLECLQIGNEADRYAINFRRDLKTWGPQAFFDEWLTFAEPIADRLPHVRLGVPDLAAKPEWFAATTEGLLKSSLRSRLFTLSYHYYVDGPPSNPEMNIPNMLRSHAGVISGANVVIAAANSLHTTWRMTEGNSCYNGGKRDVSDVFASALWSADYMLFLASLGCAGVNLHGGNGRAIVKSPTGKLMEENNVPAVDERPSPDYTPIAGIGGHYVAEPVSYGMRFASKFAGARLIALDFEPGPVNATAYAAILPTGKKIVAIINKDLTQSLKIDLPGYTVELILSGPSLEARSAELKEPASRREASLIPPASAMLLHES